MKEITRIHIAKMPYEIEIDAKKDFEQYIENLEKYTNDSEVVMDIEIRITEILAERGVKPEGVIGATDIAAVESQIGTPEEIVGSDVAEGVDMAEKKLYRDLDRGLLGGVISGLAVYFRQDVILLRLLFVVLTVVTSGFALVVYVVMWLMVPSANTAVDKLRLRGQSVTIDTITAVNQENLSTSRQRVKFIRKTLLYIAGIGAVFAALMSILAVVGASASIFTEGLLDQHGESGLWYVAYGLAVLSGLLLAVLFGLIAYACFKQDFTKRFLAIVAVIVVTGMVSFSAAVGVGIFGSWQSQDMLQSSVEENKFELPKGFSSVEELVLSADTRDPISIEYIADKEPRMVLESIPGYQPEVAMEGNKATIKLTGSNDSSGYLQPILKVYGPELKKLTADGIMMSYEADRQDVLQAEYINGARGVLLGTVDNLQVEIAKSSSLEASSATVRDASLNISHGGEVSLGNVRSVNVTHQDACPSDSTKPTLTVGSVTEEIMVNDQTLTTGSYDTPCFEFIYGEESN